MREFRGGKETKEIIKKRMATVEKFRDVLGEFKIIKKYMEGKMELTTRILNVSDKSDKKRSFQVMVNDTAEWASFWYSGKSGDVPADVVSMVRGLKKGDEATFDMFQSGKWWNINSIVPSHDVNQDMEDGDPGPQDPEREATQMAEEAIDRKPPVARVDNTPNSYNQCNAMNASAKLMNVLIEKYGTEMKFDEMYKLHQDILRGGVMKGARVLLEEYY